MLELAKKVIEVLKKAGRPLDGAEIRLVLVPSTRLAAW